MLFESIWTSRDVFAGTSNRVESYYLRFLFSIDVIPSVSRIALMHHANCLFEEKATRFSRSFFFSSLFLRIEKHKATRIGWYRHKYTKNDELWSALVLPVSSGNAFSFFLRWQLISSGLNSNCSFSDNNFFFLHKSRFFCVILSPEMCLCVHSIIYWTKIDMPFSFRFLITSGSIELDPLFFQLGGIIRLMQTYVYILSMMEYSLKAKEAKLLHMLYFWSNRRSNDSFIASVSVANTVYMLYDVSMKSKLCLHFIIHFGKSRIIEDRKEIWTNIESMVYF